MPSSVIEIGMCARSASTSTSSHAPALQDAVARENHRILRFRDQFGGLGDRRRRALGALGSAARLGVTGSNSVSSCWRSS
jgi:hypothetical protein